jgi:tetratricopeptide (TPR) repeat protein
MVWCRTGELHRAIETLGKVVAAHKKGRFRFGEVGYANMLGFGYLMAGEYDKATENFQSSLELAESCGMKWFLGLAHLFLGQVALKTNTTRAVYHFEQSKIRFEEVKVDPPFIEFLHGIILIAKGNMRQGIKALEVVSEIFLRNGSLWSYITTEWMLGGIYLQIVLGQGSKDITFITKNIPFLLKSAPSASEKAEYHLSKAIQTAKETEANSILGQAYLGLGLLYKAKKRNAKAKKCISDAIKIFEESDAHVYLNQAKEALASFE